MIIHYGIADVHGSHLGIGVWTGVVAANLPLPNNLYVGSFAIEA